MNTWSIIVAGGSGTRMGADINKVFLKIGKQSILVKTLNAFLGLCEGIVLVIRQEDKALVEQELKQNNIDNIVIAIGGTTRQDSVYNGIKQVPQQAELILVHDAARPFVQSKLIRAVERAAYNHGAAIAAVPIYDTIKKVNDDYCVISTIDREKLYSIQTPQGFKKEILLQAYEHAYANNITATDDASLVEQLGKEIVVVEGDRQNIKITRPSDISNKNENNICNIRIGSGFDVHQLVPDRKLILCGIDITYEKGLLGHSDADVATHALMDSLLGALGMGDIGSHFPDTESTYKNADSIELLKKVNDMLKNKHYNIKQADITIIAQRPKLAPYISAMKDKISKALNISIEDINIKATTTENLGFCGRGEGIAAQAVSLLEKMEE